MTDKTITTTQTNAHPLSGQKAQLFLDLVNQLLPDEQLQLLEVLKKAKQSKTL